MKPDTPQTNIKRKIEFSSPSKLNTTEQEDEQIVNALPSTPDPKAKRKRIEAASQQMRSPEASSSTAEEEKITYYPILPGLPCWVMSTFVKPGKGHRKDGKNFEFIRYNAVILVIHTDEAIKDCKNSFTLDCIQVNEDLGCEEVVIPFDGKTRKFWYNIPENDRTTQGLAVHDYDILNVSCMITVGDKKKKEQPQMNLPLLSPKQTCTLTEVSLTHYKSEKTGKEGDNINFGGVVYNATKEHQLRRIRETVDNILNNNLLPLPEQYLKHQFVEEIEDLKLEKGHYIFIRSQFVKEPECFDLNQITLNMKVGDTPIMMADFSYDDVEQSAQQTAVKKKNMMTLCMYAVILSQSEPNTIIKYDIDITVNLDNAQTLSPFTWRESMRKFLTESVAPNVSVLGSYYFDGTDKKKKKYMMRKSLLEYPDEIDDSKPVERPLYLRYYGNSTTWYIPEYCVEHGTEITPQLFTVYWKALEPDFKGSRSTVTPLIIHKLNRQFQAQDITVLTDYLDTNDWVNLMTCSSIFLEFLLSEIEEFKTWTIYMVCSTYDKERLQEINLEQLLHHYIKIMGKKLAPSEVAPEFVDLLKYDTYFEFFAVKNSKIEMISNQSTIDAEMTTEEAQAGENEEQQQEQEEEEEEEDLYL